MQIKGISEDHWGRVRAPEDVKATCTKIAPMVAIAMAYIGLTTAALAVCGPIFLLHPGPWKGLLVCTLFAFIARDILGKSAHTKHCQSHEPGDCNVIRLREMPPPSEQIS